MPNKPTFAMYWAAGCGGCEIAVLNTNERILDLDAYFDILFWPVAMDAKYADVEALPDGSIDLCLFNGAMRSAENVAMARLLRQKSRLLVAFGACAGQGSIPGLANLYSLESLLDTAYATSTTENPESIRPITHYPTPCGTLHLPALLPMVKTLDQVVEVDYFVPGCPPESNQIGAVIDLAIKALRDGEKLPPKGATLGAGLSTVCDECTRKRGSEKLVNEIRRMATYQPEPTQCLLEQGILCAGMATRSGCQARCPSANTPCIGCYGPAPDVIEQGARMMSAVSAVIAGDSAEDVHHVLEGIADPAGTFYRFGLAHSLMRRARPVPANGKEHEDDANHD